ncbi:transposase [Flavobacterium ovatum]|uniref:transposase n=1 Tax=Flavobacterium ovatum TaxID=1928857 RepID=UPI003450A86A
MVTDASVHDSQVLDNLLDKKDMHEDFFGDFTYTGKKQKDSISQKEMTDKTCKKGYKNNPLTEQDIAINRKKSRVCSRVEHVFGWSMDGMNLYAIG